MSYAAIREHSEGRSYGLAADSAERPPLRIQRPTRGAFVVHHTREGSGNDRAQQQNAAQHRDRQQYVSELLHPAQ